jgi:hypothetical protein
MWEMRPTKTLEEGRTALSFLVSPEDAHAAQQERMYSEQRMV